jgi:hypothetical protein
MFGKRASNPYDPENLRIKFPTLAKSFEASKRAFWDDTIVFDELMKRHGAIRVPPEQREALRELFSIIFYGEVVALSVSAELVPLVDDLDARKVLAAQVMEEAKHVAAFQKYLAELGGELPKINFFARIVLDGVRKTKSPTAKIFGMQLLVENLAHHLFREVRTHVDEPVLCELLEYIDGDEVKHVGLARNYLPTLMRDVSTLEYAALLARMTFWVVVLLCAAYQLKGAAHTLGIDMVAGTARASDDHRKLILGLGKRSWSLLARSFLSEGFVNLIARTMFR